MLRFLGREPPVFAPSDWVRQLVRDVHEEPLKGLEGVIRFHAIRAVTYDSDVARNVTLGVIDSIDRGRALGICDV
jgi:hypothetical protein